MNVTRPDLGMREGLEAALARQPQLGVLADRPSSAHSFCVAFGPQAPCKREEPLEHFYCPALQPWHPMIVTTALVTGWLLDSNHLCH